MTRHGTIWDIKTVKKVAVPQPGRVRWCLWKPSRGKHGDLEKADIEKVAKAIEADAGKSIPGLRDSLAEALAGKFAEVHTPEKIAKQHSETSDRSWSC